MRFILNMSVNNDAFMPEPYEETARILRKIADRIEAITPRHTKHDNLGDYSDSRGGWAGHFQTILDANGNDVGRYAFKPDDYR